MKSVVKTCDLEYQRKEISTLVPGKLESFLFKETTSNQSLCTKKELSQSKLGGLSCNRWQRRKTEKQPAAPDWPSQRLCYYWLEQVVCRAF